MQKARQSRETDLPLDRIVVIASRRPITAFVQILSALRSSFVLQVAQISTNLRKSVSKIILPVEIKAPGGMFQRRVHLPTLSRLPQLRQEEGRNLISSRFSIDTDTSGYLVKHCYY